MGTNAQGHQVMTHEHRSSAGFTSLIAAGLGTSPAGQLMFTPIEEGDETQIHELNSCEPNGPFLLCITKEGLELLVHRDGRVDLMATGGNRLGCKGPDEPRVRKLTKGERTIGRGAVIG